MSESSKKARAAMTDSGRAFEDWFGHPDRVPVGDPPYPWLPAKELCRAAWQASRAQALEEAAQAALKSVEAPGNGASSYQEGLSDGSDRAARAVERLKEQK